MIRCSYCNKIAKLKKNKYGYIYICIDCDAYVGCHKGTKKTLGTLANKELRHYRVICHEMFDTIWKYKQKNFNDNMARKKAYRWLSKKLFLKINKTHIGMFNLEQCKKVIILCKPFYLKIIRSDKN